MKVILAIAVFLIAFSLRAQQIQSNSAPVPKTPQAEAQPPNSNGAASLPTDIRPGHPLDQADVDVLTGKRDREIEASRRAAANAMVGAYAEYGNYGDYFWMNGRLGDTWDMPMLPLTQVSNPFFFGFGRRGFGGGGFGGAGSGRGGFRGGR